MSIFRMKKVTESVFILVDVSQSVSIMPSIIPQDNVPIIKPMRHGDTEIGHLFVF